MKILNPDVVNSNVFKRFLEIEKYNKLYNAYLQEPTNTNADSLNEQFKYFERQIIRIAYIKKAIIYESRKFDSKLREHNRKHELNLDAPINEGLAMVDTVQDEKSFIQFENIFENDLESLLSDELLITLLKRLNAKQKQVLYYRYVNELTEKEIAKIYNVSQQAISKMIHKSINILREGREGDD
ncbi:RNA polymerase sigma factor sigO [Solibacillus isronensis B3W22]|uniref:RNA polymerase sigma factor sigO n=1 Tax=Solibacillus isronensis B3W22 TaxID=1224748 RepID=K1KGY2_9BACL|nr:sigma factor-like helix-turn-helix DNA-binding protein [Solibacillus isronensis]AMO85147.1 RNA polymerase subunit sigma [Solibacillus silvestris]EKB43360.1 RNA polymerase sigma factor sigO [Solibacillus isronensis B3W22]